MPTAHVRPITALLLLLVTAVLLHTRVLGLSFLSDDLSILYRIGVLNDVGTGTFFRPLTDWTHWLTFRIAGPTPWAFRLINVLIMGMNAWLVLLLAHRLSLRSVFPQERSWAWIAALLFLFYPFHSEPQVWIVGRGAAMATTFVLLAVWTALAPGPATRRTVLVGVWTFLGTLCYEYALLIPGLLLITWLVMEPQERQRWLPMVLITTGIVGVNLVLRSVISGQVSNPYGDGFFQYDVMHYLGAAVKVAGRLFLPPQEDSRVQLLRYGSLVLLLVVFAILWWRRSRPGSLPTRGLALLLLLTGASAVIAIVGGVSTRTSESDRFLYLPSVFLCSAVAVALVALTHGRTRTVLIIALIALEGLGLWQGQNNWRIASDTLDRIVAQTPVPARGERVFVTGLPGDHRGAYILRHGYHEALLFAGRDTTGIIRADTLLRSMATADHLPALAFENRLDTLLISHSDRIIAWDGASFTPDPSH